MAESGVRPVSYNAPPEDGVDASQELPVALQGTNSSPPPTMNPLFGGNANAGASAIPRPFRSMPQKGADLPEMPKVRDEFDPELFNRQFHPNRQAPLFPE